MFISGGPQTLTFFLGLSFLIHSNGRITTSPVTKGVGVGSEGVGHVSVGYVPCLPPPSGHRPGSQQASMSCPVSQWSLEKPSQAAVELKLRSSRTLSYPQNVLLSATGLLGSPGGQVPAQAPGHTQQLAPCGHAENCPGARHIGPRGARVAARAS